MENKKYSKVNLVSSNLLAERLDELRKIFPEAFIENQVDSKKLMEVLGDRADNMVEKFGFMWAGKGNAIKNVLIPSKATLKPAKGESVKFDESENIFIEGDNLEVLKLLQKAYFEKVKMIYIDPPYNTGGDFVYKDDFTAPLRGYLEQTGQVDGDGNKMQTNRETNGRYHSDWLSMMYPRLKLAWNFLRDDGVIFISIDDNEVHHLRMLMDEIFGEENFVAQIVWEKRFTRSNNSRMFATLTENVLLYRKSGIVDELKEPRNGKADSIYSNPDNDPRDVWTSVSYVNPATKNQRPNLSYPIKNPITGKIVEHPTNAWKYEKSTYERHVKENRLYWGVKGENTYPRLKKFLSEMDGNMVPVDLWSHEETGTTDEGSKVLEDLLGIKAFDFPKPPRLIQRMLRIGSEIDKGDIVLDFFAGSGTTAHAVMSLNAEDGGNRKWICVQLPEAVAIENEAYKAGYKTIADITKERIRRVAKRLQEDVGHNKTIRNFNRDTGMIGKDEEMEVLCDFDGGFKVFTLDKSNYLENNFDFDPEKSEEENKKAFLEYLNKARQVNIFEKTQEIDVVYENIIKEGLSLNAKIEKQEIAGAEIYKIIDEEKQLLICLENKVSLEAVKEFRKGEYKGRIFICLDNALDDTAKANLGLNVELKTI